MTPQKEQAQFYWHIHHNRLCEPLTEPIENRIAYIKSNKPKNEVELRLRLMKPVRGKLPAKYVKAGEAHVKAREVYDKAWEAHVKAGEAHVKAREVYDKAWEAHVKAGEAHDKAREAHVKAREVYDKAWEVYDKAREAHVKAREVYDKAWEVYDKAGEAYKKDIEELHRKECPNCPWDGWSIFK